MKESFAKMITEDVVDRMLMFKKEEGKLISLRYCAKPFPLQWEIPRIRGAWQSAVHGVTRVRHNLVTKQEDPPLYSRYYFHFIQERNREVKLQVITQILSVRVRIESYKLSIHSRSFPFPVSVTA